jgi:hypothetical protein
MSQGLAAEGEAVYERRPPATNPAPQGPVVRTKRSQGGADEWKARKAARVQDGSKQREVEYTSAAAGTIPTPCEAAAVGAAPTPSVAPTRAAAPHTDPPPCDIDLLQTVADQLVTAANAGVLECGRASKAALELTSSRLAREPGSRARLVVRARAIRNLLDSGDYQGLTEWLGD